MPTAPMAGDDIVISGAAVLLTMLQAKVAARAIDEYLETDIW